MQARPTNPLLRKALICLLPLLLAGCEHSGEPLRVASNIWVGTEPLFLARDLNYYDAHCVHLIEVPSAVDAMSAMRNGTIDVAALTLDEAISLSADIPDLAVFAILDYSKGGDSILAQPGLSAQSLEGLKVGVEGEAVGGLLLMSYIEAKGYDLDKIELVQLPLAHHESAFNTELVDVLVTFEPIRSGLIATGAQEIYSSSDAPGLIVDVLVARASVIRNNRTELKELLQGNFKAAKLLLNLHESIDAWTLPRLRLTREELASALAGVHLSTLKDNRDLLDGRYETFNQWVRSLKAKMIRYALLDEDHSGQLQPNDQVIGRL